MACQYPSTIIANLHFQAMVESETNGAGAGLSMMNHVDHGFLHDAIGCHLDGGGEGRKYASNEQGYSTQTIRSGR